MIKRLVANVLIPEKINNYYLLTRRVVGFDISKTSLRATKVIYQGKQISVEKCVEVPIDAAENGYHERAAQAIKSALKQCGGYDEIRVSISSEAIIFKELTLPFMQPDKIEKVIGFEIRSLLPFPLEQAAIDFIITKQVEAEKSSTVLVAAAQQKMIDEQIKLFLAAGVSRTAITIDLFQLYNLYQQLPSYAERAGVTVLIHVMPTTTSFGYLVNGQLRRVRTIALGAHHIHSTGGVPDKNKKQPNGTIQDFITTLQFTISSCAAQTHVEEPVQQLLIAGEGVQDLPEQLTTALGCACSLFDITQLAQSTVYRVKVSLSQVCALSLAVSLDMAGNERFNLNKQVAATEEYRLMVKQVVTVAGICFLLLSGLITHRFVVLGALRQEANASEQEVLVFLQEKFKIPEDEADLDAAIQTVTMNVAKEESRWLAFSPERRDSFLKILELLSAGINREELGLHLTKLSIDNGKVVIEGSTKDIDAVNKLEAALKASQLFKTVPDFQLPGFGTKELTLK